MRPLGYESGNRRSPSSYTRSIDVSDLRIRSRPVSALWRRIGLFQGGWSQIWSQDHRRPPADDWRRSLRCERGYGCVHKSGVGCSCRSQCRQMILRAARYRRLVMPFRYAESLRAGARFRGLDTGVLGSSGGGLAPGEATQQKRHPKMIFAEPQTNTAAHEKIEARVKLPPASTSHLRDTFLRIRTGAFACESLAFLAQPLRSTAHPRSTAR